MRARAKRSEGGNSQEKGSGPTKVGGSVVSRRPNDEPTTGAAAVAGRQLAASAQAQFQSHSRAQSQSQPQSQIEDEIGIANEPRPAAVASSNRLVFGLNPRANRVKHDEYAERRAQQSIAPTEAQFVNGNQLTTRHSPDANTSKATRTAKNENSYRATDSAPKLAAATAAAASVSDVKKVLVRQRSESPERRKVTTTTVIASQQAPAGQSAAHEEVKASPRVRREDKYRLPESSVAMAAENSRPSDESGPDQTASNSKPQTDQSSSRQQQVAVPRMQFNIPPPPKLNSGSMTKSCIISYAKSRIYDKQQQQQQQQQSQPKQTPNKDGSGALLDSSSIPESISSGFKPPKQVNVSKARERWEGGEPFARCKSRQRLAQSANKKVLYGSWSMTSVVATQQMQFQQAQSKSSSFAASNQFYPNDTPVKILTRGSVLERVQQYEQAPTSMRSGSLSSSYSGSLSPSSSSSSSSSSSICSSSAGGADLDSLSPPIGSPAVTTSATGPTKSALDEHPLARQTTNKSPPTPPDPAIAATLNRRFSFRRRSSASSAIPRFYHPNGKPNTYEIELQKKNIVACFDKFTDRKALLTAPAYKRHFHLIALACGFSEYFKEPLYCYIRHQMTNSNLLLSTSPARKQSGCGPNMASPIATNNGPGQRAALLTRAASIDNSAVEKLQSQNYISCEQFLTCWRHLISSCFDNPARFVHLLTLGKRNYLLPEDFVPLIQSVIDDHPGLKFLRSAPDFHMRYIQTVIARIYFCINRSWTGKISLCELRRSNLLQVLDSLARQDDINLITDYFSYEHFYVIYCKFWSLDQDHDLLISKEDLARHNDAAISSRIIERIFTGVVSKRIQETGKMSYSDFVWFLIAEEDKKHPRSVEYWFRLMDIDGDGYISMYEMEYFYYEQTKRLELMGIEALPFLDSACQILDLINPKEKSKISLSDLKKTKLATIFFDTFINLEKYLEHESREFVSTRDVVQDGQIVSDWDRYAGEAYESLVSEESSV